jgi:hypothetical protein
VTPLPFAEAINVRYNVNWVDLRGGVRTAGALMIGNTAVGVTIFNKPFGSLWALLALGFVLILATSVTKRQGVSS